MNSIKLLCCVVDIIHNIMMSLLTFHALQPLILPRHSVLMHAMTIMMHAMTITSRYITVYAIMIFFHSSTFRYMRVHLLFIYFVEHGNLFCFKTQVHTISYHHILMLWEVYWSILIIPYTWTGRYGSVCTEDYCSIGFKPMEESEHGQWTSQDIDLSTGHTNLSIGMEAWGKLGYKLYYTDSYSDVLEPPWYIKVYSGTRQ